MAHYTITIACQGEGGDIAKFTILDMYRKWAERVGAFASMTGDALMVNTERDMTREAGLHRYVFLHPKDGRRYTVFVQVRVGRLKTVRSYITGPYTEAVDHWTGATTDQVQDVLDGNLELVWGPDQ